MTELPLAVVDFEIPPQDIRQTAHEAREAIVELALHHPEFTSKDLREFAWAMNRLRELSE